MAGHRHGDEHTDEQTTGKALRRRGLIAGAAALVAGMAAKRGTQPVAAADTHSSRYYAEGSVTAGFITASLGGGFDTGGEFGGNTFGAHGYASNTTATGLKGEGGTSSGFGVFGYTTAPGGVGVSAAAAVYGLADVESANAIGVRGEISGSSGIGVLGGRKGAPTAFNGTGVNGLSDGGYGVRGDAATGAGVFGTSASSGYGVRGDGAAGAGVFGTATSGYGVQGNSTGNNAAVKGVNTSGINAVGVQGDTGAYGIGVLGGSQGGAPTFNGTGVKGLSTGGYGVLGTSNNIAVLGDAANVGVQGRGGGDTSFNATGFAIGVRGSVLDTGYGVYGRAGNGTGVTGAATGSGGNGVNGIATGGNGVLGQSTSGTGVAGTSTSGTGVAGGTGSATPGTAGGYFYTTANNGSGVVGQCFNPGGGAAAFVGAAVAPNYAAYFTGDVVVTGNFVVAKINGVNTGGGKSAAVQHPLTNDTRLVYCVEAPEAWFEDFGEAQVVNGKAEVKVDPQFMALIHTDSYHVFLTEHGGTHHHLSVETKGANGFTVTADAESAALKGKKVADLAGTFSWRVVGKRSDTQLERLAKFTMPTIKTADKPPLEVAPPAPVKKP